MTHVLACPFCDAAYTHDGDLRPSQAVRLHERLIDHLRRQHSRGVTPMRGIQ